MNEKREKRAQQVHITFKERMGENTAAYRILVGKHKGKKPLGKPGRRWYDNMKWNLKQTGLVGRD
jgi:hypothetical protein